MAKIISVGNISMGGTGKTPFTIKLANQYLGQGLKVCVLSRGYKGKIGLETTVISDGATIFHEPPMAADEPYMIARACPGVMVITGRKRVESYAYAEKHFQPDIYILDDGFQHKKMRRDVDIVLLDSRRPLSTGFPFPFGYLREFPSALKRADIVVFTRSESETIPPETEKYLAGKPVFFSKVAPVGFVCGNQQFDLEAIRGKKVFVFSGIAKNKDFFATIRSFGAEVVEERAFRDHHTYTEAELAEMVSRAEALGCEWVVSTEKDAVKFSPTFREKICYLTIGVTLNDEQGLFSAVDAITT